MQLVQMVGELTHVKHGYWHAVHNPPNEVFKATVPFWQTLEHELFKR